MTSPRYLNLYLETTVQIHRQGGSNKKTLLSYIMGSEGSCVFGNISFMVSTLMSTPCVFMVFFSQGNHICDVSPSNLFSCIPCSKNHIMFLYEYIYKDKMKLQHNRKLGFAFEYWSGGTICRH